MILRFEENCEFTNGGSWTANEYSNVGYPVLKVSNFDKDGISYSDLSYLQISSFEKYKRNQLEIYDIVIATVGSHPSLVNSAAGRCISIPKDASGLLLNQNAVCLRTKDTKVINQRYLGYLCKSQIFQHFIQQRGKGAANQMRIPISGIKDFEFDFPTIQTQRKIASILSSYDDLIENNLKRIQLLEEKAQLTYEEWFVKMRFPGYETAKFDAVTGLPEGWEKGKLGQLLEVTSSKRIFLSDYVDEGIPFYRGKEIILKSKNEALNDLLYISNEKFEEIKNKYDLPKSGDILVTAVGTLGYPYLITESDGDFYFKDGNLIWLKKSKVISSTYLISCFKNENFQAHLLNTAIGSSQKALTISSLKDILILNPKIEIQLKFDDLIIPLLNSIENLQNQNRLLKEARDILLPRLMSGMIDVDKVSGQVGEELEMIRNKN
ncbi:restriction endonuclease subunit S [Flavobacterium sp. 7A]|uniref:restriction endonuclease subunit S n=1 Tax=Flavobacterium sp. 7A TaxID=2940571 RepID=UPI00222739C3|nr:restriction endonuclease subunit S [Flavobacterium sp. 7A]MCW2119399.1 type I restriction enzyme S subunit [Flavobacterium sp. 7A]